VPAHRTAFLTRPKCADRKSLLLGTALASTLLLSSLFVPTPASAVRACLQPASPAPIADSSNADALVCVNTEPRTNPAGVAIQLSTNNPNLYIDLYNSGALTANFAGGTAVGILINTSGTNSPVFIENIGQITATG
jgi:autotransporter family porin